MKYVNEVYTNLVNHDPKYIPYLKLMCQEVEEFAQTFYDDPKYISEWGHNYFCDIDGGRLIYDPRKPHHHQCEICGKTFTDPIYDGVWWYMYRNEAVKTMMKASACYKATNDPKYLKMFLEIISFYAKHYLEFPLHNKEQERFPNEEVMRWGCGRILPQGLNEAIITSRMIQALEIIKEDLTKEFTDWLYEKMFQHIYTLLKVQVTKIHNIHCWMNVAIGMIGFFFEKKELLDFVFQGPFNIIRQLDEGVTSDYFWYEGSIHYNYFTLEGVSMLFLFAKIYQYPFPEKTENILKNMFIAGYHFAFHNLYFPNPNDGWPSINLKTYSYIYHVMVKCLGYDSEVGNILKLIHNDPHPRTTLPLSKPIYLTPDMSFEHLLLNTDFSSEDAKPVTQKTCNFPKSNYGMIRDDTYNVFLKYGHNGPSHAHPDCMNIEIMAKDELLSRDLSNAGYRARLCHEWHRTSASHSTIVVDGKNQFSTHPGETLAYDSTKIKARCLNVYPDVHFIREVQLQGEVMIDQFTVESTENHNYDYFLHFEAGLELEPIEGKSAILGFDDNGYQHISDVKKVEIVDDEITIAFTGKDMAIKVTIDCSDKELYIAKTLDNPVNKQRTTIIVRAKGNNCTFKSILRLEEKHATFLL